MHEARNCLRGFAVVTLKKGVTTMQCDWDDPASRARLIESVGAEEYNRLFAEHRRKSVVATVNGYDIRPVLTRLGRLFAVDGTRQAYTTLKQAKAYAESLKTVPACSICGGPLYDIASDKTWKGGNNAQPINGGRCCDHCDMTVVIPARLRRP
jgi:hypothetical protein